MQSPRNTPRLPRAATKLAASQVASAAAPEAPAPASSSRAVPAAAGKLVRIADHGEVCMLSNRFFGAGKQQVPADADGKKYYGCCARCAARLAQNAGARTAIDPVTGNPVDKASAVLAHDASNQVLYFESEASFARYGLPD
jgi:hypothetical protein